jgi:hypothetical protein
VTVWLFFQHINQAEAIIAIQTPILILSIFTRFLYINYVFFAPKVTKERLGDRVR